MSDSLSSNLKSLESLSKLIDSSKSMNTYDEDMEKMRKNAPSVFMTDARFKESVEAGDFIPEDAFLKMGDVDKENYEMVQAVDEKSKKPLGWVFRFKTVNDSTVNDEENEVAVVDVSTDTEDEDAIAKKAASIMAMMSKPSDDKPSVFLTDARFKEMIDAGELVSSDEYDEMDDDAKGAFEEVDVYEEGTGKGYGKRYRRRSPLELTAMRKAQNGGGSDSKDMFDTEEEALQRAGELGCQGTHGAGDKIMPCATHSEWMRLSEREAAAEAESADAMRPAPDGEAPMQAPPAAEPMMGAAPGMKSDDFLCGFQRKSVSSPCDFCHGGCSPEDGMPGLGDIENLVKTAHSGEVIGSGYSTLDDMFVVDVKREDGSCIEVFLSGDGEELGWLRVDETLLEGKSAEEISIISSDEAEAAAVKALSDVDSDAKSEVMGVMVDVFANEDVYVVQLDTDAKSYDFFVAVDGKVVGYDEYERSGSFTYSMSEDDEIKALEAELEIKRLYSREQRESMAESGEAMPDGSFPIADEADLSNAIQAHGRAKDIDAAKAHIMKRAEELGLEDMIPEEWSSSNTGEMPPEEETEKSEVSKLLRDLSEFQSMLYGEDI